MNIGILATVENDSSNTDFILKGIVNKQKELGWKLFTVNPIGKYFFNRWEIETQPIDGILLIYHSKAPLNYPSLHNIPRVNICPGEFEKSITEVTNDDISIGRMAAEHLKSCGYKSFAFVGSSNQQWSNIRKKTFVEALRNENPPIHFYEKTWDKCFQELIDKEMIDWLKNLDYETGIFTVNDKFADKVIRNYEHTQREIPNQLGIISADNDAIICDFCSPGITSIQCDFESIGYQACALLDHLINDKTSTLSDLKIQPKGIMYRESTLVHKDPYVASVLKQMHSRSHKKLTIAEICKNVPISKTVLFERFKKEMGTTMHQYLMKIRLNSVCHLLINSSLRIQDIAQECHFTNVQRMDEAFKKHFSQTPNQYRKKNTLTTPE